MGRANRWGYSCVKSENNLFNYYYNLQDTQVQWCVRHIRPPKPKFFHHLTEYAQSTTLSSDMHFWFLLFWLSYSCKDTHYASLSQTQDKAVPLPRDSSESIETVRLLHLCFQHEKCTNATQLNLEKKKKKIPFKHIDNHELTTHNFIMR